MKLLRYALIAAVLGAAIFCAETERLSWAVAFPLGVVTAFGVALFDRIKVINLGGAKIEAYEKEIGAARSEIEAQKAEMAEIVRRGRAPFLRATILHVPAHDGLPNQIFHFGEEVDRDLTPAGIALRIDVANDGEEVRNFSDDWIGEGFTISPRGLKNGDHATNFLYKYDPHRHGQTLKITISFETLDGLQLSHTYETRHGFCVLTRVDPR